MSNHNQHQNSSYHHHHHHNEPNPYKDCGPDPATWNLRQLTMSNNNFRTTIWTGEHMQITLMSIKPRECIGVEIHENTDQLIVIESGTALIQMGNNWRHMDINKRVSAGYAIIIPAGTCHNIINNGSTPLKLYSVYAPPEHPNGTVNRTKPSECSERQHEH